VNIRSSIISKYLIGRYFLIPDGLEVTLFQIHQKYLGIKIGQLVKTRKKPEHDKKKKKKIKKKKVKWDTWFIQGYLDWELLFIEKCYII
jgi:ribosomal protein S19